jgi:hypothetical protein
MAKNINRSLFTIDDWKLMVELQITLARDICFQLSIANRQSSILALFRRLACCIESAQAAAILAFSASVRVAGCADFPFLQRQPAGPVAGVASSGSLAVRAFMIGFSHSQPPSFRLKI